MDSGVSSALASLWATLRAHFLLMIVAVKNFTERAERKRELPLQLTWSNRWLCCHAYEARLFSLFLKGVWDRGLWWDLLLHQPAVSVAELGVKFKYPEYQVYILYTYIVYTLYIISCVYNYIYNVYVVYIYSHNKWDINWRYVYKN